MYKYVCAEIRHGLPKASSTHPLCNVCKNCPHVSFVTSHAIKCHQTLESKKQPKYIEAMNFQRHYPLTHFVMFSKINNV
jgi:hypothetical protein